MNEKQALRIKSWSLALSWTGLIYSTLYIVRPVCAFLKENIPFDSTVNFVIMGVTLALALWIFRRIRAKSIKRLCLLAVVVLLYIAGFLAVKHPEEKLHFIEYGVLAYLFWNALKIDIGLIWSYFGALLLTGSAGWFDEIIQNYLPNRYYQITDVQLNFYSAFLALAMVFIFQEDGWCRGSLENRS